MEAGTGTGYRGALKWAYLNSKAGRQDWAGVSEDSKSWATSANMKNLDTDDPRVMRIADEMGATPEEAIKRIRKLQKSGENYASDTVEAQESLQKDYNKFLQEQGVDDTSEQRNAFLKKNRKSVTDFLFKHYRERGDKASQENKFAALSTAFGGLTETQGGLVGPRPSGRDFPKVGVSEAGDRLEASQAQDQRAQMEVLKEHLPDLTEAAKTSATASLRTAVNTLTAATKLTELMDYINKGGEGNEKVLEQFMNMLEGGGAEPGASHVDQQTMGNSKGE